MGNSLCAVDGCTRTASIELSFGVPHANLPGRQEPDLAFICEYHALAACDYFDSIGIDIGIDVRPRPRVVQNRQGRPIRFPARRVRDSTE